MLHISPTQQPPKQKQAINTFLKKTNKMQTKQIEKISKTKNNEHVKKTIYNCTKKSKLKQKKVERDQNK